MTNYYRRIVSVLGLLALSISVLAETPATPRIPLEDFFRESDYSLMRLSPDGKYLAFLTTLGTGKVGIALMDLSTGKVEAVGASADENIKTYFWKGSEYIVYGGDLGGNESPAWRSVKIQPDKNGKRKVVAISEAYVETRTEDANFLRLVDELKYDPYHFIGWGRKNIGDWHVANYLVDIRDGKRTPVLGDDQQTPDVIDLVLDNTGAIRARSRYDGKNIIYEVRPQPTERFAKVAEFSADDPKWDFHYFAADNQTLYVVSREKTDTGALCKLDAVTGKLSEPIFHTPEGEIGAVMSSYDRTKLYGVSYATDTQHYQFFDAARAQLQAVIDKSLPNSENVIVSASADEQFLVIASASDRNPGTYYLFDRKRPSLSVVGQINSAIKPAQMQPMQPIEYKARDGLSIHGYLTLPAGAAGKKVPLIIHPHGGPFGIRDDWGFDPEVQFLANRGYAVLQINYRGSGGYGMEFQRAGRREWGGKMQDDLTDGVKWAIAQGFADPARVAIYGASYGGYATLAGVTFTPELYCCGANYVGVSDLAILKRWGTSGQRSMEEFIKDWVGTDRQYQHDHSPVNFVDRIRVPTLHAYGYNDPRVDIDHWKELEPKLKQYNKPYEIIVLGDEGHGFRNEGNRIAFYHRLEAFFDKNIPKGTVKMEDIKVLEMPARSAN